MINDVNHGRKGSLARIIGCIFCLAALSNSIASERACLSNLEAELVKHFQISNPEVFPFVVQATFCELREAASQRRPIRRIGPFFSGSISEVIAGSLLSAPAATEMCEPIGSTEDLLLLMASAFELRNYREGLEIKKDIRRSGFPVSGFRPTTRRFMLGSNITNYMISKGDLIVEIAGYRLDSPRPRLLAARALNSRDVVAPMILVQYKADIFGNRIDGAEARALHGLSRWRLLSRDNVEVIESDKLYEQAVAGLAPKEDLQKYRECVQEQAVGTEPEKPELNGEALVTLNFVNADIQGILRAVTAITGDVYIYDPSLKGSTTLYSEQPITALQVKQQVESTLRTMGYELDNRKNGIIEVSRRKISPAELATWGGQALIAANLLAFVILVAAARKYAWALDALTSKFGQRFGVYFSFALTHSKLLQTWILERYMTSLKVADAQGGSHPYISTTLRRVGQKTLLTSEDFISSVGSNSTTWVQGVAGVGKTELMRQIVAKYSGAKSLYSGWKEYGFIPVFIPLRNAGKSSLPALVQRSLAHHGVNIVDTELMGRILSSGGFLLLLDGMNESVDLEEEVSTFLYQNRGKIAAIVTSQSVPIKWTIGRFELLAMNEAEAKLLVDAFLGERKADVRDVPAELWLDIRTGYDCRLLASLLADARFAPRSRVGLYREALMNTQVDTSILAEAAYKMYLSRQRRFGSNNAITREYATVFVEAVVLVLRGNEYEFVHDLMRAFMAADYLVECGSACRVLADEAFWLLPRADQQVCLEFLVGLASDELLAELGRLAAEKAELRASLLGAVQTEASRRDIPIGLTLGGEALPLRA